MMEKKGICLYQQKKGGATSQRIGGSSTQKNCDVAVKKKWPEIVKEKKVRGWVGATPEGVLLSP